MIMAVDIWEETVSAELNAHESPGRRLASSCPGTKPCSTQYGNVVDFTVTRRHRNGHDRACVSGVVPCFYCKDEIMRNSVGRHACISEKMLKTSDFELVDVVGKLLMCAISPSCVRARGTMNVRKD